MSNIPNESGRRAHGIGRIFGNLWAWIGLLWIVSLGLGYIGLSRYAQWTGAGNGPIDLIYLLLQLITLESGAVAPPIPWQLEVARFALPALAGWTVVRAAMTLFWEQAILLTARFWRHHVIICGLSYKGFLLTRDFIQEGRRVLIIEINEDHGLMDQVSQMGALVLAGDATDPHTLLRAGIRRASALISVTGEDGTNAEVAVRANALLSSQSRSDPLHCVIHVVDPSMWDLLREWSLNPERFSGLRLDIFNIYQRGAELLVKEFPPFAIGEGGLLDPSHMVVIGLGNLARHLILHSAERWYRGRMNPEDRLEITAVDRYATTIIANLGARFPQLADAAQIRAVDLEIGSPEFVSGEFLPMEDDSPLAHLVFICLDDDPMVLSTGLMMRRVLGSTRGKIVLRVLKAEGLSRLISEGHSRGGDRARLEPFAIIERVSNTDLLVQGTHERLARALHEAYLLSQGAPSEGSGAMSPWDQLPEGLRRANRTQADHIGVLIDRAKCSLELLTDWGETPLEFTEVEVERLARLEHERWCREKRRLGWRYAPGSKDEGEKTHPDLTEWEELPEPEREKNRAPVRELPKLLHRAGYRLSRHSRDPEPA